jgi:hypothetical protein
MNNPLREFAFHEPSSSLVVGVNVDTQSPEYRLGSRAATHCLKGLFAL